MNRRRILLFLVILYGGNAYPNDTVKSLSVYLLLHIVKDYTGMLFIVALFHYF